MKKSVFIVIICLVLALVVASTYRLQTVGADSGFDSSWDSGSGSSWDSSSSWDSGSGGGADGLFELIRLCIEYPIVGITIVSLIIIYCLYNKHMTAKKTKEIIDAALASKLELEDLSKYDEDDPKKIRMEAFNIYKKIQYAWMMFDEETLRKCLTDEMYNMYLMQLDTLKVKNEINIMYDIKYLSSYVEKEENVNGQDTIVISLEVSCHDFVINKDTKAVVRGNAIKKNFYVYELTFVKTESKSSDKVCPNCGAKVEANNSGVCEYCKSTLVSKNYTLIMSKKKMKSQR